jgi:hypothetical protein
MKKKRFLTFKPGGEGEAGEGEGGAASPGDEAEGGAEREGAGEGADGSESKGGEVEGERGQTVRPWKQVGLLEILFACLTMMLLILFAVTYTFLE